MENTEWIACYYKRWRQFAASKRYDRWCEKQDEHLKEQSYAEQNLEPEYWCWNCKYSECEKH